MKGMAYNGWKVGLPDKFWPVTLDNFFENPDEIRELGLRMMESDEVVESRDEGGLWPGCRSKPLWKKDEELTKRIIIKILGCYFNFDFELIFWNCHWLGFQLVPSFDKDKNNIKNKGWIHRDSIDPRHAHRKLIQGESRSELAGLIYLTPDIERDTGTSLFNMKKDKALSNHDNTEARMTLYKGDPVNDEEIKEQWEKHRNDFIEKVRFENIYNRLIMYDTKEFHGVNSYYTPEDKDDRLTLAFFIEGIRANKWPLERIRETKIC